LLWRQRVQQSRGRFHWCGQKQRKHDPECPAMWSCLRWLVPHPSGKQKDCSNMCQTEPSTALSAPLPIFCTTSISMKNHERSMRQREVHDNCKQFSGFLFSAWESFAPTSQAILLRLSNWLMEVESAKEMTGEDTAEMSMTNANMRTAAFWIACDGHLRSIVTMDGAANRHSKVFKQMLRNKVHENPTHHL